MPADLSTARNPLPYDRTPEAPSPATAALYRCYQELIGEKTRKEAIVPNLLVTLVYHFQWTQWVSA